MTGSDVCSRCGKPKTASNVLGSLTSYLFRATLCQCDGAGNSAGADKLDDDSQFCPKCGLQVVTEEKIGSLTAYLFQSTRCKCPRDQAFAKGQMSAKFWKLKKAGSNTIFAPSDEKEDKIGQTDRTPQTGPNIGLAPGAIIGGVYEVIEIIGRGGMGEVYLARHQALGKKCALKVIPPEQVTEMGWQRFQIEARTLAKLDHANIVKVTDLGIHDGCLPFYAMEYVRGKNLADLLAEHGLMPLSDFYDVFMQVCDGVECAHRNGILHRDLKPGNIMVSIKPDGKKIATVLDFGLAKLTAHDRSKQSLTAVGDVFGSPFYMSPEQCNGEKLDNRSDIYSIGCTMFECLTGRTPFAGHLAAAIMFSHQEADPPSLADVVGPGKFPTALEVVIAKLLRKNPVERYQTMSQLKGDLERVKLGQDVLPVYANRSFASDSEVSNNTSRPVESGVKYQSSNNIIGLFLVVFAILLLGGTFAAAALFGINSFKVRGKTPPAKAEDWRNQSEPSTISNIAVPDVLAKYLECDGEPFFKGSVEIKGKRYDKWVVPSARNFPFIIYFKDETGSNLTDIATLFTKSVDSGTGEVSLEHSPDPTKPGATPKGWVELFQNPGTKGGIMLSYDLENCPNIVKGLDSLNYSSISLRSTRVVTAIDCLKRIAPYTAESIDSIEILTRILDQHDADLLVNALREFPNLQEISGFVSKPLIAAGASLPNVRKLDLVVEFPSLNREIASLRNFKNLRVLTLDLSSQTAEAISAMSQISQLEQLACTRVVGTSEQISEIAKLPNLTYLELPQLQYHDGLLDELSKLKQVDILIAGSWPLSFAVIKDRKVVPEGVFRLAFDTTYIENLPDEVLSDLKNMTQLKIEKGSGTRMQLSLLSRLPKLTTLEWTDIEYRPDLAREFKRLPSLRKLILNRTYSFWNSERIANLKRDLPGVEVDTRLIRRPHLNSEL